MKFNRFEPSTKKSNAAIIYAHGGGYVGGSVKIYSRFLAWLAESTGTTVFCKLNWDNICGFTTIKDLVGRTILKTKTLILTTTS